MPASRHDRDAWQAGPMRAAKAIFAENAYDLGRCKSGLLAFGASGSAERAGTRSGLPDARVVRCSDATEGGDPGSARVADPEINLPEIVAEVTAAFMRYEE